MSLAFALAAESLNGASDVRLIKKLREQRGALAGPICEGQLALARWMLGEQGGEFPRSHLLADLSDDLTIRFLTGEAEPDYEMAQLIAVKTKGAVMPQSWARAAKMPSRDATEATQPGGATACPPLPQRSPLSIAAELATVGTGGADYGAMLVMGDLLIIGPGNVMRVPSANIRPLFNQMGPLLSTIESGAPG